MSKRPRYQRAVAMPARRLTPAVTSSRPIWLLGVVGGVALAGLALWVALSPAFRILDVQVIGANRVPAANVLAASGLVGQHILQVDRRGAAEAVMTGLPSIEYAVVSCRLPAHCTVHVVERPPVLTWEAEGAFLWVDEAGGAYPADNPLPDAWLVQGPLPEDWGGRVPQPVLDGLAELSQLGVRPGRISYHPGRGLVLDDPEGWRVVLGEGKGMGRRLQVYALVRDHLLARGIHPRFVDVRFPEAPYYSEVNDW